MKKNEFRVLVGAAALLVATGAWAGKSASKFTGCLQQGDKANEFKLTNVNGGSEEYELLGGKGLKEHVGHKVEITGKKAPAKQAAKSEKEGMASEAGHEHLRVGSMKHIAATCP